MQTNMQSLAILGRQPALGLAELESLYGPSIVRPIEQTAALIDVAPQDINFDRLGGSVKLAKVLTTLSVTDWREIESYLVKSVPTWAELLPKGKLQLGLSAYGLRVNTDMMLATGLSLKKAIKKTGRPVRLVPNKEIELNSASILHNNLTGPTGWELLLVHCGQQTIIAQTVSVQDIDSYTIRDRERPMRDARVGMLPPKLAQIIINLAAPNKNDVVLDPFCGTGVLLQEALLMNCGVYGSDIEPRMIEYTHKNIEWLKSSEPWFARNIDVDGPGHVFLEVQDATSFQNHDVIDVIASETYLGKPFTSLPSSEVLNQTASDCNLIIKKFLVTVRAQLARGTRLCLAVPAWQIRRGQFKHLPLLDSLRELGYNRISFEHARADDLIYFRADQIVARELLVLQKL
jgi:tRNA G10  N-methylase Trm11